MFEPDRLSPDFQKRSGLLVYSRLAVGEELTAFKNSVTSVLKSKSVRSALVDAVGVTYEEGTQLSSLVLEDALRDPRMIGRTIRTLCDAPIAVFDATIELPSLMLLLGMRSVVRRGITVVVRVGNLDAAVWQELAFTLREIRLVAVSNRSDLRFEQDVRHAVVEGLTRYARHPFSYSDLPAFDAIRALGGETDDYALRTPDDQVLVLCPFDRGYTRDCWPELQRALRDYWTPGTDLGPARRVIDLQSPELVGRRLFEAIRRDEECVADLTLNRPNVFFELGARLVANEFGARAVRCQDMPAAERDNLIDERVAADAHRIDDIVGTQSYSVSPDLEATRVIDALRLGSRWQGGSLTAGYAFSIAQDSVDIRQEGGGRAIETLLWRTMEDVGGRDRTQKMTPVMYAYRNAAIRAQARRFTFETLLAYVLVTDKLPQARRDQDKRAIALLELEDILKDLTVDAAEQLRLKTLLQALNSGAV